MKSLTIVSAAEPNFANPPPPPVLSAVRAAEPDTATLSARYALVEDIDYLMRTGRSRQVLALRWTR
ncbi:MAG: hypothetical protein ABSB70_23080 [Candidatus Velthaea sp.]|jgi:hypothetical protein